MEQKVKLNWKKFSNTSIFQILFDKENTLFLKNIFSHKLTEFEIENLPSFYIISFVEVLQNYIYYFLKNDQNSDDNNNEYEQIINSKNNQIEKLNEKIKNFQEILNQKDIELNNSNKKLIFIYEKYNQLEQEYKMHIANYEKKLEEKEEDFQEMGDKLLDTFSYINKLVMISNIDDENKKGKYKVKDEIKQKDRSHKNLYNVKTYQEEGHKSQETNIKKQNSLVPKKKKKEIKIV
jgi:hypothetical protein